MSEHTAENDAASHRHPWFECETCRERVNRQMDARLRDRLIADGVPAADADLLIAEAREMGQDIRKTRDIPPASGA